MSHQAKYQKSSRLKVIVWTHRHTHIWLTDYSIRLQSGRQLNRQMATVVVATDRITTKCASFNRFPYSHLIHVRFFGPTRACHPSPLYSQLQRHLDRFQLFCQTHVVTNRHRDRETDRQTDTWTTLCYRHLQQQHASKQCGLKIRTNEIDYEPECLPASSSYNYTVSRKRCHHILSPKPTVKILSLADLEVNQKPQASRRAAAKPAACAKP